MPTVAKNSLTGSALHPTPTLYSSLIPTGSGDGGNSTSLLVSTPRSDKHETSSTTSISISASPILASSSAKMPEFGASSSIQLGSTVTIPPSFSTLTRILVPSSNHVALLPTSTTSISTEELSTGSRFPVGAVVGSAVGALVMTAATLVLILWIRNHSKHKNMPAFEFLGQSAVPQSIPSTPTSLPLARRNSSSSWGTWGKLPEFGHQLSTAQRSFSIDDMSSNSDISTTIFHHPDTDPQSLVRQEVRATSSS
ncbi:hypothetical protein BKA70DRAFT_1572914 [Coprinopsis sp. MPI-PUGE-AT-0042]|nr:hypothetical protein BKA70DRAFT_1572914 [Coprinopsis sp. MPI-PUGE-AT-0042]